MIHLRLSSSAMFHGTQRISTHSMNNNNKFFFTRLFSSSLKHKQPPPKQSSICAAVPTPIWRKIVQRAKSDPGNLVMNAGAIMSLSGFMMSDVMHLRTLNICGSFCGMAYNMSRNPPQYNAVAWGLVFVSVNMYHLYHLYLERTEDITFHHNEMMLYSTHFKDWGVQPWQFKKLVKLDGCEFRTFKRGDIVVEPDKPLDDILMVIRGEVGAEYKDTPPLSQNPMYTYKGDGTNGCVVGGTALVDPLVRQKDYPNRLVAHVDETVVVTWNTDQLSNVMHTDKDIESAVLHALYVELIQGLRRDRKTRENVNKMSDSLLELERMIEKTLENAAREENKNNTEEGGYNIKLKAEDKKAVRIFASENRFTTSQRESVLWKHGWTPDEWDDGVKQVVRSQH